MAEMTHAEQGVISKRTNDPALMRPKRILLVSTTSTVAYVFVLPLANYLRTRGHEVSFACSTADFSDARSRAGELRQAGYTVHEIDFPRGPQLRKGVAAYVQLRRLTRKNRYDVVHTFNTVAGFIGRLAARSAHGSRVIHTAYDFYFREYAWGLRRWLYLQAERLVAPMCDQMLFITEAIRRDAVHYKLKEEIVLRLVGCGIEVEEYESFDTDVGAARKLYGCEGDTAIIGTVGRLVPHKGMDTFLRAAAIVLREYPKATFIVGGDGPLRAELEELAGTLGIAARVKFNGYLPEMKDVMRLMASLDVFALATRREGLGVVYLEAMALGKPVVGSRIPPVTEVIKEGETGLLANVDDAADFARAMVNLLRDPEGAKRLGRAGREHVRKCYDIRATFEKTEAAYLGGAEESMRTFGTEASRARG